MNRPLDPAHPLPPRKSNRSHARTAAIVAGGAGLAYGGVQVGRAAQRVAKAADQAGAAAANLGAATKTRRAKFFRKVFGFSKGKKDKELSPAATMGISAGVTGAAGIPSRPVEMAACPASWGCADPAP